MNKGVLALFISYFIGGSIVPTAVKLGVNEIPPMMYVALRFSIATLVFIPLLIHTKKKFHLNTLKNNFKYYLLFCSNAALFTIGIQFTTALISQLLYTLTPVFVGILGHFILKEKLTKHKILGSLIAFSGVIFLLSESINSTKTNTFGTPIGNIIVLIAVISWSFFLIFSKKHSSKYGAVNFTFASFVASSIVLVSLTPFEGLINNQIKYSFSSIGLSSVGIVGVSSAVMFALMQYGIKKTEIFTASILMYFGPFFTAITAIPILHEKITFQLVIGGAIVCFGVFYATAAKELKKYILQYVLKD